MSKSLKKYNLWDAFVDVLPQLILVTEIGFVILIISKGRWLDIYPSISGFSLILYNYYVIFKPVKKVKRYIKENENELNEKYGYEITTKYHYIGMNDEEIDRLERSPVGKEFGICYKFYHKVFTVTITNFIIMVLLAIPIKIYIFGK